MNSSTASEFYENYEAHSPRHDDSYSCRRCGAVVEHTEMHDTWHGYLDGYLKAVNEKAKRYKPPPVYGGL